MGDGEDLQQVQQIQDMRAQLAEGLSEREDKCKEAIAALTATCDACLAEIDAANLARSMEEMKKLEADKNHVQLVLQPLIQEEEFATARTQELSQKLELLELAIAKLKKDTPKIKQRLENSYSLYFSITNIVWDSDAKKLAGAVECKEQKRIREFDLSDMMGDPFFVADSLWNLVAGH